MQQSNILNPEDLAEILKAWNTLGDFQKRKHKQNVRILAVPKYRESVGVDP